MACILWHEAVATYWYPQFCLKCYYNLNGPQCLSYLYKLIDYMHINCNFYCEIVRNKWLHFFYSICRNIQQDLQIYFQIYAILLKMKMRIFFLETFENQQDEEQVRIRYNSRVVYRLVILNIYPVLKHFQERRASEHTPQSSVMASVLGIWLA